MSRRPPPAVPLFGQNGVSDESAKDATLSATLHEYEQQYASMNSVEAIQRELDAEMEMRVSTMRMEAESHAKNLKRKFETELARLPDFVRKMTLSELMQQTNGTGEVSVLIQQMSRYFLVRFWCLGAEDLSFD
jgi:hypothetical protein